MKLSLHKKIILSILSGLILSLAWLNLSIGWAVLIGFVPLLFVMESLINENKKNKVAVFFFMSLICFITWNTITTWWIYHATLPGAIAAVLLSSLFKATVSILFFNTLLNFDRRIGYMAFVSFWISFEYIFMNSQISWPWLILGNAFANNVQIIQWYEFVGHIGGSLWVLIINLLIYEILRFIVVNMPKPIIRKYCIILAAFIFIPIGYSLIRYNTYTEIENPVDIVVIQPNIDSYVEKYTIPPEDQIKNIIELAKSKADENVDYFVAPETAIPYGMWVESLNGYRRINMLRDFMQEYPNAKLIIGADTRKRYIYGKNKTITARLIPNSKDYYDIYNTALQIDTSLVIQQYHKSKLVPGVEMLPYPKIFGFMEDIMLDLGGMSGSHGTQEERTVMTNNLNDFKVAVPICYESVYGGFVSEWVKNGANLIFIITNDGWWEDTPGYKQHNSYARIRAIETRRSIARSANTGISSFVNQRGDILEYLPWDKRGAIRQTINANDKLTFFVRYGDFIARMSLVFTTILLIVQVVNRVLRKVKEK